METGSRTPHAHLSAHSLVPLASNKPLFQGPAENRLQQLILDPQIMSGYFRSLGGAAATTRTLTSAELLEHQPSNRSLVLYTGIYRTNDPLWGHPWVLLGKWFADPSQAVQLFQLLQTLQTIETLKLNTPRPIGLIPELSLVLYEPTQGCSLGDLLTREDGGNWMRRTGEWLAHFHSSTLPVATQFRFNKEFFTLHDWMDALKNYPSSIVENATVLTAYLHRTSSQLNFEFDTPIHRDFHYNNIFIDQTLCVTNFDDVCLGDPNFDLAHFSAYLTLLSYRLRQTSYGLFDQWQAFLDGYAAQTGWKSDERFDYFYVYACLKLAWQLSIGTAPVSPIMPHIMPRIEDKQKLQLIEMILKQGLIIQ